MKVILVNFLYSENISAKNSSSFVNTSQIGLMSLNTLFNEGGINCEIVDLNIEKIKENIDIDIDYYINTARKIKDLNPDYIGFTAMGNNFVNVIILSLEVRKLLPNVTIFLGGPQASAVCEQVLNKFLHIDFICIGESEVTIKYLIKYMKNQIKFVEVPSIIYRLDNGLLHRTERAALISNENFVYINYDLLIEKYDLVMDNTLFQLEGGRGCPYNCVFCSTSTFWERHFRIKPIDKLKAEISEVKNKYGAKRISIVHDLFTCDKKMLHEFCEAIKKENIKWGCSSRIDVLNEKDIFMMKESGCEEIFYGVETGSQKMQYTIGKRLDLSKADEIIKFTSSVGINPVVSFIIGFPFENIENIEETLQRGLKYIMYGSKRCLINILAPEHNSMIMEEYKSDLIFEDYYYINSSNSIIIDIDKELGLIKEYPDLFNEYYFIKNEHFNYYYLCLIKGMYELLIKNFKTTLTYIVKNYQIKLTDLFLEICEIEKSTFISAESLNVLNDTNKLTNSFIRYIKNLKSNEAEGLLKLELIKMYCK